MAHTQKQPPPSVSALSHIRLRSALPLIVLLIALYVLVPRVSSFDTSWAVLRTADVSLVVAAVCCIAGTNLAGAMVYTLLATKPIPYLPMVLVQVASSFTNRLLPAGTGAMATCAAFLIKHRHTPAQAGSVAALNNLLGFVGNVLLLTIVAAVSDTPLGIHALSAIPSWIGLAALALAAAVLIAALWWAAARRVLREVLHEARRMLHRPGHLLIALASSVLLTICFGLALELSAQALGVHLSLFHALYIVTAGVAAGAVTPVPGGLGGVEAGMVAALLSVGVAASPALAVVLLYRLVSYWLPIVPGFICFQIALQRRFI